MIYIYLYKGPSSVFLYIHIWTYKGQICGSLWRAPFGSQDF